MRQTDTDARRRDARLAAIVIVAAALVWVAGQTFGGALGLPARFAFLLDLAALAAFVFALVILIRIWRSRRKNGV